MDLQPDLTFAARRVVLRTGDLWLPQAADTSGPRIPRGWTRLAACRDSLRPCEAPNGWMWFWGARFW